MGVTQDVRKRTRSMEDDKTPRTLTPDDDIIAWFTNDFADAAEGVSRRARQLGVEIRNLGREACAEDRAELFRMIALLCRAAHIIFADLDE